MTVSRQTIGIFAECISRESDLKRGKRRGRNGAPTKIPRWTSGVRKWILQRVPDLGTLKISIESHLSDVGEYISWSI
jgi:hypothetical protein